MKQLVIEREKLEQNIDIIKSMTDSVIIAVIKANAYGMGFLNMARIYKEKGIDHFAVSSLDEAIKLRQNGFEDDILLLNPAYTKEQAQLLVENSIAATIVSHRTAYLIEEAAKKLGKKAKAHIEIDTGFGKMGFLPNEMEELCSLIKSCENIAVEGTYTHLSYSFEKKQKISRAQMQKFLSCVETLKQNGIETGLLHIANTSAFFMSKQMHLDAVRIGSAFLGRLPIENRYNLHKVGYLKSEIMEIRHLPRGHNIGYANTFKTKKATKIGVVPVGFTDGLEIKKARDIFRVRDILVYIFNDLKSFFKKFYVIVNGKKAQIIGRIRINDIVIDLSDIEAKVGDEVYIDVSPVFVDSSIERVVI